MASRTVRLQDVGDVTLRKRRGSRSVRMKVDVHGRVIVTMPPYVPYKFAEQFVGKHREWLLKELSSRVQFLREGQRIGRVHILRFEYTPGLVKPTARVTASKIVVRHSAQEIDDPETQAAAFSGAVRALKREGERYLLKRLHDVAESAGFSYTSANVRQLRGRWGSCTSQQHITLNCFLMQLPAEYIDYVIYHELVHTRVLDHGPAFWQEFETHLPGAKRIRREMKQFQPTIPAQPQTTHRTP